MKCEEMWVISVIYLTIFKIFTSWKNTRQKSKDFHNVLYKKAIFMVFENLESRTRITCFFDIFSKNTLKNGVSIHSMGLKKTYFWQFPMGKAQADTIYVSPRTLFVACSTLFHGNCERFLHFRTIFSPCLYFSE